MTPQTQAYFFALGSAACFSSASLIFADIARIISPLWMNAFKALVAWVCFGGLLFGAGLWISVPIPILLALLGSGIIGLAIGDIFLLTAYARMGSARTLILFGFQPLFIGVAAHFFFNQQITWLRALAVLFFIACLFTFSLEKFREFGHWELVGLGAALIGVLFDNTGVLLTRWSFDHAPTLTAFQANFIRCSGALLFFMLCGAFRKVHLLEGWRKLEPRSRGLALLSSVMGTFLSLFLYLTAIKIGHLASIAALGAASPILSSGLESVYLRKPPSTYLLVALSFFIGGFVVLTLT